MTQQPQTGRRGPWLHGLTLVVAFALTALGIYWIGVSSSTTRNRVGFPVALWGVLIGAYALHGTRWTQLPVEVAAPIPTPPPGPGEELELRRSGEVELAGEAERRREYQLQLEVMLRREIEKILRQELAALRADVAGLRGEVLDAVDGRLRLERIETTRIIGSDLAALQNEVRRLNVEREGVPVGRGGGDVAVLTRETGTVIEPGASMEARRETDLWTPSSVVHPGGPAEVASDPTVATAGSAPAGTPAESSAKGAPTAEAESTPPSPRARPAALAANPTHQPAFDSDPFAGLPRLSAFRTSDEPGARAAPAPTSGAYGAARSDHPAASRAAAARATPTPAAPARAASAAAPTTEAAAHPDNYVGRRRRG